MWPGRRLKRSSLPQPRLQHLEQPLDPGVRNAQEAEFKVAYPDYFIEPEDFPCDPLYNRNLREFRSKRKTVEELSKVRSLVEQGMPQARHTHKVGELEITIKSDESIKVRSFATCDLLQQAHLVLCNCWAATGTALRDSKARPEEKVRDASTAECQAYHSFFRRKAREHPGPEAQKIHWLIERDRETRLRARGYYNREGWPWGEALRKAREQDLAVIWTVGAQSVLPQQLREPNDDALPEFETPTKASGGMKRRFTSAEDFCAAWNNGKCSKQAKDCPHLKVHCCNFVENGQVCGKWQHTAMVHRKWASQDKGNTGKQNKGKGKAKHGKQRF